MPYNQDLAEKIRQILVGTPDLKEMIAFGGISFLIGGNMACGVIGNELIVRVGPENHAEAVAQPNVRIFDMTGRAMRGWVTVAPSGLTGDSLNQWIFRGVEFAKTLPPK